MNATICIIFQTIFVYKYEIHSNLLDDEIGSFYYFHIFKSRFSVQHISNLQLLYSLSNLVKIPNHIFITKILLYFYFCLLIFIIVNFLLFSFNFVKHLKLKHLKRINRKNKKHANNKEKG